MAFEAEMLIGRPTPAAMLLLALCNGMAQHQAKRTVLESRGRTHAGPAVWPATSTREKAPSRARCSSTAGTAAALHSVAALKQATQAQASAAAEAAPLQARDWTWHSSAAATKSAASAYG